MATMGKDNNKSIFHGFVEKVKKLFNEESFDKAVEDLAFSREMAKRAMAGADLMELIEKQEREIRRLRPDIEHYAEDGTPQAPYYSKAQMEALKKAKERLEKMIKAFEKARKGDMEDVYNLTRDKSKGGQENKGGESS